MSELFAKINAADILYPEAMWTSILTGPRSDQFRIILNTHTHKFVDQMAGKLKLFIQKYLGHDEFLEMKDDIAAQVRKGRVASRAVGDDRGVFVSKPHVVLPASLSLTSRGPPVLPASWSLNLTWSSRPLCL